MDARESFMVGIGGWGVVGIGSWLSDLKTIGKAWLLGNVGSGL